MIDMPPRWRQGRHSEVDDQSKRAALSQNSVRGGLLAVCEALKKKRLITFLTWPWQHYQETLFGTFSGPS